MAASKVLARVTTVTADNTISPLRADVPSLISLPIKISLRADENITKVGTFDKGTREDDFQMKALLYYELPRITISH